ncbi:hypothetical protein BG003_002914 [Podila horticola]|nr:hypothetical protein BG003_002914 [Podila horticola]
MYLALAIGRPHLSNQTHHSVLRVLVALALVAGLIYAPAYEDNSFARDYICSRSDKYHPDNAELLVGCQVNVARDILYLVTALLVLMEFGFDFRVCELGKSGQKQ